MGTYSQLGSHKVNRSSEFFAEHGYLEVPSLVQWMATLKCGLRCEHCLAVSRESGFSDMPLEKVRRLIDEIATMRVREFLLTGGEPLARDDLAEVIAYLGRKNVTWTLNTAAMPSKALREVIAQNQPGFVAVSLDGPSGVHDAFRGKAGAWDEATEAMRFFKSLEAVTVCAGTTVTRRNYDFLDETFHLVTASGADRWGIHLLVPEGKAGERPDLFLSKAQLKRLIKFVARKRRYFNVQMADEIGYLGYLEPLVRDVPLTCGAGRSQCVVLPDGEIVPCTTLDRACSAGNIYERRLMEIWADGFGDLRAWRPSGQCSRCDYSAACKGGCWLQRKAGTHCFKDVWHVPGALKTAAGVAICLGGLAAPAGSEAADTHAILPPEEATLTTTPAGQAVDLDQVAAVQAWTLDDVINNWYFELAAGLEPGRLTPSFADVDSDDVGWQFARDFTEGTLPQDIVERCASVCDALETEERSLSLIALLWRAVSEPLLETGSTRSGRRGYSGAEELAIRHALATIEDKAQTWRLEIFVWGLDPYLSRGRTDLPHGPVSKAGPRPGDRERYALSKDLNEERWGVGMDPDTQEAAVTYLLEHRYAEQMDLVFGASEPIAFGRYGRGGGQGVISHVPDRDTGLYRIGPFDVIEAVKDVTLSFEIKSSLKVPPRYAYGQESLLDDQASQEDLSTTVQVSIPADQPYTYLELLNAIHEQQRDLLLSMAYDWLLGDTVSLRNADVSVVAAVHQNGALLWPAFREIIASDSIVVPTGRLVRDPTEALLATQISEIHRRAVLKDIDFWMF